MYRQQLPMLIIHFRPALELLEVQKFQKKTLTVRFRTTALHQSYWKYTKSTASAEELIRARKLLFEHNNMQSRYPAVFILA